MLLRRLPGRRPGRPLLRHYPPHSCRFTAHHAPALLASRRARARARGGAGAHGSEPGWRFEARARVERGGAPGRRPKAFTSVRFSPGGPVPGGGWRRLGARPPSPSGGATLCASVPSRRVPVGSGLWACCGTADRRHSGERDAAPANRLARLVRRRAPLPGSARRRRGLAKPAERGWRRRAAGCLGGHAGDTGVGKGVRGGRSGRGAPKRGGAPAGSRVAEEEGRGRAVRPRAVVGTAMPGPSARKVAVAVMIAAMSGFLCRRTEDISLKFYVKYLLGREYIHLYCNREINLKSRS